MQYAGLVFVDRELTFLIGRDVVSLTGKSQKFYVQSFINTKVSQFSALESEADREKKRKVLRR